MRACSLSAARGTLGRMIAFLALCIPSAAWGVQPEPPAAPAPQPAPPVVQLAPLTRAEFARAYLEFERLYHAYPPRADRFSAVNQAFDRASMGFLSGNFQPALRELRRSTIALIPEEHRGTQPELLASLTMRVDPPVWTPGGRVPWLRIRSVYPLTPGEPEARAQLEPITLPLTLRAGAGAELTFRVTLSPNENGTVDKAIPLDALTVENQPADASRPPTQIGPATLPDGSYEFVLGVGELQCRTRFARAAESPDDTRADLERRLADIQPLNGPHTRALDICRARLALLNNAPSEQDSAQFLSDPWELAAQLRGEVETLAAGASPYQARGGADVWRPVIASGVRIPARVYAPKDAGSDGPAPLVIALHGAGGDESMFMDGYGAGAIKRLADARRFVVVAPQTMQFTTREAFSALLAQIGADYSIDPERVYVIGHSMGAGVAAGLARSRRDEVAGVVCIAGGRFMAGAEAARSAPVLVIAGALDPIVRVDPLRGGVEAARAAGAPLELRVKPDHGHTLIVGDSLSEAVDWLLSKRLTPP